MEKFDDSFSLSSSHPIFRGVCNRSSKLFERNNYTMVEIKITLECVCVCASRWFLLHLMLSIHSQCSVLTKPVCLTSFHAFHIAMEDTTFERESSFARRFQQLIHTVRKSIALKSRNALAKMFGYEKKRESERAKVCRK